MRLTSSKSSIADNSNEPGSKPRELEQAWEYLVMKNLFARFVKCQSGATAIEYGLIAALIGVFIITIVGEVGTAIKNTFTSVKNGLASTQAA